MNKEGLRKKAIAWHRQEIISAAKTVFLRKGFHKATMDDVARETGLSKGTLYLYFPSKENLLVELIIQVVEDQVKLAHQLVQAKEPSLQKIENYVYSSLEYFQENRDLVTVVIMLENDAVCKGLHKSVHDRVIRMVTKVTEYITLVMKEGIKEGVLKNKDPQKIALVLTGILHMFITTSLFHNIKFSTDEYAKFIIETFLEGVKK
jgi:AcrR family transcriptional regulator